jgi:single-stranded-DNA-specific exonuclease
MRLADVDKKLLERFPDGFSPLSEIPKPSLLADAKKASERVAKAIQNREKITIIGDYDVDGVVSSAISYLFFKELGFEVEIIIPNRFRDGYGITPELLTKVKADLIITVDNGIHGFKPAEICKERGIDLIITDHHNPSDSIPEAFAVVNPKRVDCLYPYKEICGAQVIWLLLGEVKRVLSLNIDMGQFLDLIAVAVISDVMPITGLNHSIVKAGLSRFAKSERDVNRVIMDKLFAEKRAISSEDIAFQLSPRLNSSGRMEDAKTSFEFLTSSSYLEASQIFDKIDKYNEERKFVEKDIFERVAKSVDSSKPVILFYGEDLHEGVIGIVASRVVEKFGKPAFIFSKNGNILKGSGRSLGNIDIFYILTTVSDLLLKWGGHKMAGGLSINISNWEQFCERVWKSMDIYTEKDFMEISNIFGELSFEDLDFELMDILKKYEPYGNGNEKPIFLVKDAKIIKSFRIGKNREYQRIVVEKDNLEKEILVFQKHEDFLVGDFISFSYRPNISTFRNETRIKAFLEKLVKNC